VLVAGEARGSRPSATARRSGDQRAPAPQRLADDGGREQRRAAPPAVKPRPAPQLNAFSRLEPLHASVLRRGYCCHAIDTHIRTHGLTTNCGYVTIAGGYG